MSVLFLFRVSFLFDRNLVYERIISSTVIGVNAVRFMKSYKLEFSLTFAILMESEMCHLVHHVEKCQEHCISGQKSFTRYTLHVVKRHFFYFQKLTKVLDLPGIQVKHIIRTVGANVGIL